MCLSRDYKVCNGKEGELAEICHYTEIVYCLSDGIVGSNTPFENAIMCVWRIEKERRTRDNKNHNRKYDESSTELICFMLFV